MARQWVTAVPGQVRPPSANLLLCSWEQVWPFLCWFAFFKGEDKMAPGRRSSSSQQAEKEDAKSLSSQGLERRYEGSVWLCRRWAVGDVLTVLTAPCGLTHAPGGQKRLGWQWRLTKGVQQFLCMC